MLNSKDVSEYLKISADGLEVSLAYKSKQIAACMSEIVWFIYTTKFIEAL